MGGDEGGDRLPRGGGADSNSEGLEGSSSGHLTFGDLNHLLHVLPQCEPEHGGVQNLQW